MQTYIIPVVEPHTNLSGFLPIHGQTLLNSVDGQRVHMTEKFKILAEMAPPELAFQHTYITFCFQLPVNIILEMQQVCPELKVTAEMDGLLAKGLVSASLWTWKRFLPLGTHKDQSEWLIKAVNEMYINTFINIPYFKDLKSNPLSNSIFALVKV